MYVCSYSAASDEVNVFFVHAKETAGVFFIDEPDQKLLFGRKRINKNRLHKPWTHKEGKQQWTTYFFGSTKEEAIQHLLKDDELTLWRIKGTPYYQTNIGTIKARAKSAKELLLNAA